jgi:hypothetical protein
MPLAAKEEMSSTLGDPCVFFPLAADPAELETRFGTTTQLRKNSRQEFTRKNPAPHQRSAWSNSARALGIEEVLLGSGVGCRSSGNSGGGLLSTIKSAVCSALPSGRATSVSAAAGGIGSVSGSVDMVVNYNSGQTSLFATGGGGLGWNGGGSLTATTGLVYGLDGTNSGFSGPFKGANFYAPTPIPGLGAGGSITHGGGVTVVSVGVSGALAGRYGGGASWTNTTNPLNVGKFSGFAPLDYVGYLLRRPCN